jgi:hypothetical protein
VNFAELDNSDWHEAFAYAANETRAGGGSGNTPQPTQGYSGSLAPFDREDVTEIIALSEGEKDGRPWLGVFRLKDGRFASLIARCDHTGWDCKASGDSWVGSDLGAIILWGLTDEARIRLNLPLSRATGSLAQQAGHGGAQS